VDGQEVSPEPGEKQSGCRASQHCADPQLTPHAVVLASGINSVPNGQVTIEQRLVVQHSEFLHPMPAAQGVVGNGIISDVPALHGKLLGQVASQHNAAVQSPPTHTISELFGLLIPTLSQQ